MRLNLVAALGAILALGGLVRPWAQAQAPLALPQVTPWALWPLVVLGAGGLVLAVLRPRWAAVALLLAGLTGAFLALLVFKQAVHSGYTTPALPGYWTSFYGCLLVVVGALGRLGVLVGRDRTTHFLRDVLPPAAVPFLVLLLWEGLVEGHRIPRAIFPKMSDVYQVLVSANSVLLRDSSRTFVREVLFGYALGVSAGLVLGTLVAFSPFLRRGFLPLATASSAVPIVGLAPVLGRAFGVDWQSKAAVVVVISFFPMLVNVVQGLNSVEPLELDLLRSYAATPGEVFRKLRFPNALPYIFNALKVAAILALISVIVAEFLIPGPPEGLGQRISLSARSGGYDVTFATIAFASVIGIGSYSVVAALERLFTFWHSSFREGN
ncbi:MAG: ABC transporter permease [Deinococcus sp.]|nr:ABC transporter permease [Deinococcus sp.]